MTNVIDSRYNGTTRRRRHCCEDCGFRFTTYELQAEEYERLLAAKFNASHIRSTIKVLKVLIGD